MKIILASASPRRQELLKLIYPKFEILPANVAEKLPEEIGFEFAPVYLAAMKAEKVAGENPGDLIIAADTIVIADNQMLGKPKTKEEAFQMLKLLSGNTHKVITGCCLQLDAHTSCFAHESLVHFYPLTDEEICAYIASGEPMDKAGAYGIQGKGALFVESIEGDYFNIMGLPIARLKRELDAFLEEVQEEKHEN